MPSPTDISNIALANIGAENLVSSIDPPDGSVEAGYCATFYPIARTVLLEASKPAFAVRSASLASVTNTSTAWDYAYARPSDALKLLRIVPTATGALLTVEASLSLPAGALDLDTAPYAVQGDVIFTNEPDAVLVYVWDQVDTTKWTPLFADAVAAMVSGYLAGPLIKGRDGASIGQQWRQQAYRLAAAAAASVANNADEPAQPYVPSSIRARQ